MRRVDRLFQIIQMLRRERVVTAQQLSERLGVSERTIYRDIDHLSASGVPILSERGVGYRMRKGYDLPPIMFDEEELKALWLGARMVSTWSDDVLTASAQSVMDKVAEAIDPEQLRALDGWNVDAPDAFVPEGMRARFKALREATEQERKVRITYLKEGGHRPTERVIRPLGLFFSGNHWIIGAWCELRDELRTFRLDRISSWSLQEDAFEPDTPTAEAYIAEQKRRRRARVHTPVMHLSAILRDEPR